MPTVRAVRTLLAAALCGALALPGAAARASAAEAAALWPGPVLEARVGEGAWQPLWTGPRAPERWTHAHVLADSLRWRPQAADAALATLELRVAGARWTMRVVLVRLDPARVRFTLPRRTREGGLLGGWDIDRAPRAALFACDAGQFTGGEPWGWLVRDGVRERRPGTGPLSAGVCIDSSGAVRFVSAESLSVAANARGIAQAFQSYPLVLARGEVPALWRAPDTRVNAAHRDSRLGLGLLPDRTLLFALTRVVTPGGALDVLPIGPTAPEMAALLGALGCTDAVLLDGGLSGQMLVRDARGRVQKWKGLRRVPLGIVALPREAR